MNRFAATSLFTLLEMVDSDLGVTFHAGDGGRLGAAEADAHSAPGRCAKNSYREVALGWRKSTARADEFNGCSPT